MTRMTAHELENAYDDLKAENDRLTKAIEDIWKCPDCDPDFWVCKKHRKYFKKALEEAKPEGSK